MSKMMYVENHSTNANFNFALEEYLMTELDINEKYFIFWRTKPTLMIGRHQNALQEINMDYAKANHINIVRRVTGGGTIYTDMNGWQFSFIEKNPTSNHIDFAIYTKPIIDALASLGVTAVLSGRNDLLIDGKKFSGNAARNKKDVNLHHGSILFDTDLEALVRALNVADEKIISKGIKSVKDRVTNVADHLNTKMTSTQFRDAMLSYLLKDMDTYQLTEKDVRRVNEIKERRFDTWEWNIGKTPAFNRTKEQRFAGGKLIVCAEVDKGVIKDIQFYGDFFANKDVEELSERLKGCKFGEEDVRQQLEEACAQEYFFNITNEEIMSLII